MTHASQNQHSDSQKANVKFRTTHILQERIQQFMGWSYSSHRKDQEEFETLEEGLRKMNYFVFDVP